MSDVRETARFRRPANLDAEIRTAIAAWQPVSVFEEHMSVSLRRNERARRGYERELGQLSDHDQRGYQNTQVMLKEGVQKVIWIKEFARLTGEDGLPGIGLVQDGLHVILAVPSLSEHFTPKNVLLPIGSLDEGSQRLLPPLSEEAVIKGLENADRRVKTAEWHLRKSDGDWETLQEAVKDKLTRFVIVIKAKHGGNLPEIELSISEEGEKVILSLPPTASRTEPLPIDAGIKALETVEPNIRDLLALRPTSPQG